MSVQFVPLDCAGPTSSGPVQRWSVGIHRMGEAMVPSSSLIVVGRLLKLRPQVKLPSAGLLQSLSPHDLKVLRRLLTEPVEYVTNDALDRPGADQLVRRSVRGKAPAESNDDSGRFGLDDFVHALDREQFLFLRLNYCRQRVYRVLAAYAGRRLSADAVRELLHWERLVHETRGEIVRENVPLVLAMAKRTRIPGLDLTDLISDGNLALLRAVHKFDCARGYKFSTYACRAILKSFSRVAARTARYRGHFPTEYAPALDRNTVLEQTREAAERDCVSELKAIVGGNTAHLSDVERTVIAARFALDSGGSTPEQRAQTLEQVGELIGVTKERVRQIQNKALDKLREALEQTLFGS
jgi:RNA polymerase sigma factor (sigma-70 family)